MTLRLGPVMAAAGVAIISAVSAAAEPHETEVDLDALVARIEKTYNSATTFEAHFVQEVRSPTFGQVMSRAKGEIKFKQPGLLRWEYRTPEKRIIVVNDTTMWDYSVTEKQAIKADISNVLTGQAPRAFLFGGGQLSRDFEIAPAPEHRGADRGLVALVLTPKTPEVARAIRSLEFLVEPDSAVILETLMRDPMGNVNHLAFSNIKRGRPIRDAAFEFTPPRGVKVLGMHESSAPPE